MIAKYSLETNLIEHQKDNYRVSGVWEGFNSSFYSFVRVNASPPGTPNYLCQGSVRCYNLRFYLVHSRNEGGRREGGVFQENKKRNNYTKWTFACRVECPRVSRGEGGQRNDLRVGPKDDTLTSKHNSESRRRKKKSVGSEVRTKDDLRNYNVEGQPYTRHRLPLSGGGTGKDKVDEGSEGQRARPTENISDSGTGRGSRNSSSTRTTTSLFDTSPPTTSFSF